jgi:hypothetical protein
MDKFSLTSLIVGFVIAHAYEILTKAYDSIGRRAGKNTADNDKFVALEKDSANHELRLIQFETRLGVVERALAAHTRMANGVKYD